MKQPKKKAFGTFKKDLNKVPIEKLCEACAKKAVASCSIIGTPYNIELKHYDHSTFYKWCLNAFPNAADLGIEFADLEDFEIVKVKDVWVFAENDFEENTFTPLFKFKSENESKLEIITKLYLHIFKTYEVLTDCTDEV